MKRSYVMAASLLLCIGTLIAGNVNTLDVEMGKAVQKKSKELIREMNLSGQQKTAIRQAQTLYFETMIKAVKEADDPLIISDRRNTEETKLNNSIRSILNEAQYDCLLKSHRIGAATKSAKKEIAQILPARIGNNMKSYCEQGLNYYLEKSLISKKYENDPQLMQQKQEELQASEFAAFRKTPAERRIEKIIKDVDLSEQQQSRLYQKFHAILKNQPAINEISNEKEKAIKLAEMENNCNTILYSVLSEKQIKDYIITEKLPYNRKMTVRTLNDMAAKNPEIDVMQHYDEVLAYLNEKSYISNRYENDPETRKIKWKECEKKRPGIFDLRDTGKTPAEKRIEKIIKDVDLSEQQQSQLHQKLHAILENQSAIDEISDEKEKIIKLAEIENNCNAVLYSVLSEKQIKDYIITKKLPYNKKLTVRILNEIAAKNLETDVMQHYDEVLTYLNEKSYIADRYEKDPETGNIKWKELYRKKPGILELRDVEDTAIKRADIVFNVLNDVTPAEKDQILALAKGCETQLYEIHKKAKDDLEKKKLQTQVKDHYQTALLNVLGEARAEQFLVSIVSDKIAACENEYKKILKEKAGYSDEKIASLSTEIHEYARKECTLAERYKYNLRQRDVASPKLRAQMPNAIRYAKALKNKSDKYRGTYQW